MDEQILERHMQADADFQDEVRKWKETVATKDDISIAVKAGMDNYFKDKGKMTYSIIVGASVFIGALMVIFGGLKTLLGLLGFTQIK